jgi:ABC-type multidrug transport system fused ATPase/permease subunit
MSPMTEPPICEAGDVSVAYDAAKSKFAIQGVSVAVRPGEIVAILRSQRMRQEHAPAHS